MIDEGHEKCKLMIADFAVFGDGHCPTATGPSWGADGDQNVRRETGVGGRSWR